MRTSVHLASSDATLSPLKFERPVGFKFEPYWPTINAEWKKALAANKDLRIRVGNRWIKSVVLSGDWAFDPYTIREGTVPGRQADQQFHVFVYMLPIWIELYYESTMPIGDRYRAAIAFGTGNSLVGVKII